MEKIIPITEESLFEYDSKMKYSHDGFIRRIFRYLRGNPSLTEEPDYRRLYEETLEYQIRNFMCDKSYEERRSWLEFLADIENKDEMMATKFSREQIDRYLEHRRTIWNKN